MLNRIIIPADDGCGFECFKEGKLMSGRLAKNIRQDQPTHLQGLGQVHAHVHNRNGQEVVVVNFDGTASHGKKGRLHQKDANLLRTKGYNISNDNIVEYVKSSSEVQLFFG